MDVQFYGPTWWPAVPGSVEAGHRIAVQLKVGVEDRAEEAAAACAEAALEALVSSALN